MTATILAHPFTFEARRNWCTYPNAERGDTVGWSTTGTATLTASTLVPHSGLYAYRIQTTAANSGAAGPAANLPVGAGIVSAWITVASGSSPVTAYLFEYEGGVFQRTLAQSPVVVNGQWNRVVIPYNKTSSTSTVRLVVQATTATAANIYVDDVLYESGAVLGDYFDGNKSASFAPPAEYSWVGQANQSASVQRVPGGSDTVTPASVLAPWVAESDSMSTLHPYMDDPSSVAVTWRPPGPRHGTLDMLFDDPAAASTARVTFATHSWFELQDTDFRFIEQFVITPGQQLAYGQVQEGTRVAATGKTRWHVVAPWTEVVL